MIPRRVATPACGLTGPCAVIAEDEPQSRHRRVAISNNRSRTFPLENLQTNDRPQRWITRWPITLRRILRFHRLREYRPENSTPTWRSRRRSSASGSLGVSPAVWPALRWAAKLPREQNYPGNNEDTGTTPGGASRAPNALVPSMRKPFDVLAEGLDLSKSRGDRIRTCDLLTPSQTR